MLITCAILLDKYLKLEGVGTICNNLISQQEFIKNCQPIDIDFRFMEIHSLCLTSTTFRFNENNLLSCFSYSVQFRLSISANFLH